MGQSYKNRKRTEEAADFFARAVAADERYVPAYLALGQLFFEVGALDEAAEVLEDALEIDGKNAEAQMLLGMIHALRGEDAKARRMLSALEKNDPNKAKQLRKWMENK
jgi:tetratricopeptide (TPR) repeat protein